MLSREFEEQKNKKHNLLWIILKCAPKLKIFLQKNKKYFSLNK